ERVGCSSALGQVAGVGAGVRAAAAAGGPIGGEAGAGGGGGAGGEAGGGGGAAGGVEAAAGAEAAPSWLKARMRVQPHAVAPRPRGHRCTCCLVRMYIPPFALPRVSSAGILAESPRESVMAW